jgi:hypothetical protein
MGYLFLLGGEVLWVGRELLHAPPYKGEIVRDGFKLLPQLKRGSSRG